MTGLRIFKVYGQVFWSLVPGKSECKLYGGSAPGGRVGEVKINEKSI